MEFTERKRVTELLLDAAALFADLELLERTNPRSRVLARRYRLHNLQFEVIWELLLFVSPNEISNYRSTYSTKIPVVKEDIQQPILQIEVDLPKKNTLPRKKSTQQSNGKK